jgi:glycosyltransferase involved in cell wall biosynthesis
LILKSSTVVAVLEFAVLSFAPLLGKNKAQMSATVGVVVPMFNARRTIGETVASVCRQTYKALDIVVVDDGSTDESAAIVAAHAKKDRRVRLLRQVNGGVAAARNFGAAATDTEFLAFIDADDLWAPSKIELQMQTLQEGGAAVGLAYCWYAQINEEGRVISLHHRPTFAGHVLQPMCRGNFVGNGSSMLVRRSAFELAGQFDASLRARNAQGCEDLLLCLRIAEKFEFRVVPQYLVGYRMTSASMSNDVMQMLRSGEIVLAEFREKYPQFSSEIDAHLLNMAHWLAVRGLISGEFRAAYGLLRDTFLQDPRLAISRLPQVLRIYAQSRLVPRWVMALLRRTLSKKAEFWSVYTETSW